MSMVALFTELSYLLSLLNEKSLKLEIVDYWDNWRLTRGGVLYYTL
jgi:hypothetical protein